MKCRQMHGFLYESKIIQKYSLVKSRCHTSKYDAYTKDGIPVQIKCIKNRTSISFGDFQRNQNHSAPFILIIGFWQSSNCDIIKEHVLLIDHGIFSRELYFLRTEEMLEEMKKISNNRKDDADWKQFRQKWKSNYPKKNLISLYFKRDHKIQTRIQCGISYKKFTSRFLKLFQKHTLLSVSQPT